MKANKFRPKGSSECFYIEASKMRPMVTGGGEILVFSKNISQKLQKNELKA